MYFSKTRNGFIPQEWIDDGTYEKIPADAIELTDVEIATFYKITPPAGKELSILAGRLAWVELAKEELTAMMESQRQLLINNANALMNGKQWPGKAAIGRLKGDELTQYNEWLDYLDALEAVDTSSNGDVNWPASPEL
ncbi:tail fiber assembly protein [Citrobacter sp. CF971]|uniref:tail fiber assembly protein n=1 Tax=Citrobacter sp. CF971 TaxID=2566012 RepID=UPI00111FEE65|nr:tail fiber assembly protein [Citrobacter sp. CF971]EET7319695.1 tail fiber assembly protein [Escherichia coli]QDE45325.1 tail fiber assembly protein [Citrobacter sp. CF971]